MTAQGFSTSFQTSVVSTGTLVSRSGTRIWAGRFLTGIAASFFVVDGGIKLFPPPIVVETTVRLGYAESTIARIGMVLLACTLLYLIPRTAVAGAILLTGYLGGAVATHVRVSAPWFNIILPILFGVFVWGGLVLRRDLVGGMMSVTPPGGGGRLVWAGRLVSAVPALLFLMNGVISLFKPAYVVQGTVQLGYPESSIVGMGVVVVVCALLYLIPRTTFSGAVLLTGYLGGAVATHVRLGDTWGHILLPVFFGGLVWSGLWMRNRFVREFFV